MKNHLLSCLFVAAALMCETGMVSAQASDADAAPITKKEMKAADRTLVKHVRAAFHATKGLDSSSISVLAKDGAVALDGTVPEDGQIALAESAAKSVDGVKSVKNLLHTSIKQ